MLLAAEYLAHSPTPLAAYNGLQLALMRVYVRRGGRAERWADHLAAAFRRRYGWMLGVAAAPRPGGARPEGPSCALPARPGLAPPGGRGTRAA